ncbi:MAG: DUF488 domain-containing protein [Eggerthellaceae bacterium]|jgi:uncharacterized protein YeaO (DUF488 family)
MADVQIKRVYEPAEEDDGYRVLVDRLWPRGVRKADLTLDRWAKELAPSTEARRAFNHDPAKFDEFRARYTAELDTSAEAQRVAGEVLGHGRVTLLYAAKNPTCNHALVLQAWLQKDAARLLATAQGGAPEEA